MLNRVIAMKKQVLSTVGLPIIHSEPELRTVPREAFLKRLRENVKTPRTEGVSSLGKPAWLRIRPPSQEFHDLKRRLRTLGLVTVCQESHCPNMSECWSGGTATFMVLGDTCTRACKFCAVKANGKPAPPDTNEPQKLVQAVGEMNLTYIVITAVDRDDLPDGGAAHFAACVRALKTAYPNLLIEILSGDFQGNERDVQTVIDAGVDVFAHNVETVRRLQESVRDRRANYEQSLGVLRAAKRIKPSIKTKTSLMVGLGETYEELLVAMDDARVSGVDIITFGQYLRPSTWHLPVERYMPPNEFAQLERDARTKGFDYCAAGPFVRSSYRAGELFIEKSLRGVTNPEERSETTSEATHD
jgi:lipoic acid synthetase